MLRCSHAAKHSLQGAPSNPEVGSFDGDLDSTRTLCKRGVSSYGESGGRASLLGILTAM